MGIEITEFFSPLFSTRILGQNGFFPFLFESGEKYCNVKVGNRNRNIKFQEKKKVDNIKIQTFFSIKLYAKFKPRKSFLETLSLSSLKVKFALKVWVQGKFREGRKEGRAERFSFPTLFQEEEEKEDPNVAQFIIFFLPPSFKLPFSFF